MQAAAKAALPEFPDRVLALLPQQEFASRMFDDCAAWDVGRADARVASQTRSEVPALLMSGSFDAATSPRLAAAAAEGMPNSGCKGPFGREGGCRRVIGRSVAFMVEGGLVFGVLDLPDAPFATLEQRWKLVEDLGFDQLWLADQTADFRNQSGPWVDGWIALTVMARHTSRVRIGPLVSNPIMRHPVILAKQVVAVDELSGGRLELGLGTGIAPFDHEAVGTHFWSPKERAGRFDEYVRILDELLTSAGDPYDFDTRFHGRGRTRLVPSPLQRPRPPLTVAGQSPTVRRVAAERADCWNTHGPFGASFEEILDVTRAQVAELDRACESLGRDPSSVRRSVLLFEALDPWESPVTFEEVVSRFAEMGFREFVVFWPGDDRRADLEDLARRAVPALRGEP